MINLYEIIVVEGIEQTSYIVTPDSNKQPQSTQFFVRPEVLVEEDLKDSLKSALLVSDSIIVCNMFKVGLGANIPYKIGGSYIDPPANATVYLSTYDGKTSLRDSIIDSTMNIENEKFSFPNVYQYDTDTTLAVWVEIRPLPSELGKFNAYATAMAAPNEFTYVLKSNLAIPDNVAGVLKYTYNALSLPVIETVWTDKTTYPHAVIGIDNTDSATFLVCATSFSYLDSDLMLQGTGAYQLYTLSSDAWKLKTSGTSGCTINMTKILYNSSTTRGLVWADQEFNNMSELDTATYTAEPVFKETTRYNVWVEGYFPKNDINSTTVNLVDFYYDTNSELPEYQVPEDYGTAETEVLVGNVVRGLYELENGILEPSSENEDFQNFYSSLTTINSMTGTYEAGAENVYSLSTEWGTRFESNHVLVWLVTPEGGYGALTIEDQDDTDNDGVDGVDWRVVCLSGDTLITMADGTQRRLDSLKEGDLVLSEDGQPDVICSVRHGSFNPFHIKYYFNDGTVIDETHDHRFYNKTQGFWQRLKNWKVGDIAVKANGEEVSFARKEVIQEKIENFGIFTKRGTYYANGLLSGAARCNRSLLANATLEQAVDMILSIDEKQMATLLKIDEVLM